MDGSIRDQATRLFELPALVDDRLSDRKRRLFALACLRRVAHLLTDPRSRRAMAVAERCAEGRADDAELAEAELAAFEAHAELREGRFGGGDLIRRNWRAELLTRASALLVSRGLYYAEDAADYARRALAAPDWRGEQEEEAVQCRLLRDVVGPWPGPLPPIDPLWRLRHDGAVVQLARQAYDLETFDLLPIVADALEDAGCSDPRLLEHLRRPGEHVRGCWVLDLLLGRD